MARLVSLLIPLTLFLAATAAAKKSSPSITSSEFQSLPGNLLYFEDSDTVLFQDFDNRVVYRSEDAGENWSPVSGVQEGDALGLWMHPFDHKRAYILTAGTYHYATKDRGERWHKFNTDMMPIGIEPLRFHADDPDKIIFLGVECSGPFCDEEVSLRNPKGVRNGDD
jgi:hypothetical protein